MIYQRKPYQIEAYQWNGDLDTIPDWLKKHDANVFITKDKRHNLFIENWGYIAELGDYLFHNIDGWHIFHCAKLDFEEQYELVP